MQKYILIGASLTALFAYFAPKTSQSFITSPSSPPSIVTLQYHGKPIKISYKTTGNPENSPLIILHGMPGSSRLKFPVLEKTHHCISIDRPGYASSTFIPSLTPTQFAEILQIFMETVLPSQTISLAAHSLGAPYALAYATTYPSNVSNLYLYGPASFSIPSDLVGLSPVNKLAHFLVSHKLSFVLSTIWHLNTPLMVNPDLYFRKSMLPGLSNPDKLYFTSESHVKQWTDITADSFNQGIQAPLQDILLLFGKLPKDTLDSWGFQIQPLNDGPSINIIQGTDDNLVTLAQTETLAKHLNVSFTPYPNHGHFSILDL